LCRFSFIPKLGLIAATLCQSPLLSSMSLYNGLLHYRFYVGVLLRGATPRFAAQ
jgi:hypothetical protein